MKYSLVIIFLLFSLDGFTQAPSKEEFKTKLASFLNSEYNITKLPDSFYDCGYNEFKKSESITFDTGYLMSKKCLMDHLEQIEFSDKGLKMMESFGDAFVNGCTATNSSYKEYLYVGRFCKCLHKQYLKYEIGYEDIFDPEFTETILSQKIATYCLSINEK